MNFNIAKLQQNLEQDLLGVVRVNLLLKHAEKIGV